MSTPDLAAIQKVVDEELPPMFDYLEKELAKIDANRVRYSASTELVSRRLALLRYAASDGNG